MRKTFVQVIAIVLAASVALLAFPSNAFASHNAVPPVEDVTHLISKASFKDPNGGITAKRTGHHEKRYTYWFSLDGLDSIEQYRDNELFDPMCVLYVNGERATGMYPQGEFGCVDLLVEAPDGTDGIQFFAEYTDAKVQNFTIKAAYALDNIDGECGREAVESHIEDSGVQIGGPLYDPELEKLMSWVEQCESFQPFWLASWTFNNPRETPGYKKPRCKLDNLEIVKVRKFSTTVTLKKNKKNSKCLKGDGRWNAYVNFYSGREVVAHKSHDDGRTWTLKGVGVKTAKGVSSLITMEHIDGDWRYEPSYLNFRIKELA